MMFNNVNRGKRSIALDLRTAEGRGVLESLVQSADVVLENFSRRAAHSLRLTYEDLRAVRDDVVLASISAFGRSGPWGEYVALHSGVILLSGLASITRDEAGVPRLPARSTRTCSPGGTWPSRSRRRCCFGRRQGMTDTWKWACWTSS